MRRGWEETVEVLAISIGVADDEKDEELDDAREMVGEVDVRRREASLSK
jgi:hypothetical protein